MTTTLNILVLASLAYVIGLFLVAWAAERGAAEGRAKWARSPLIYTLSLSVYCTAWTFFGAVGYAARSGLEFVTIYIGPTLVLVGWWLLLRKMVRVGRSQRITSVADLLSSRFGKSNTIGVLVTALAVLATTPYIALQLQSVTQAFASFAEDSATVRQGLVTALLTIGLIFFTILFGTRNLDVNERHHGVVMAIAIEAVVKLAALLAVGVFVVWGLGGGLGEMAARIAAAEQAGWQVSPQRWTGLVLLSAAAFIALPRMYQVMVVEIEEEDHLRTASWAFPSYLLLMSLFVVPIAVMGLERLPEGSNPDLFVLSLPLSEGKVSLAILAFVGGFSSATSMVIVSAIALATMISNHIFMPLWLRARATHHKPGDVALMVLRARRAAIILVITLGYAYSVTSGSDEALAAIGLIAFVGIVQVVPALIAGLYWRGATRKGAVAGLAMGFAIWLYCLLLPNLTGGMEWSQNWLAEGPAGLGWLRPHALFGSQNQDPLLHALFWSWVFNIATLILVSLISFPRPLERLQGAQFVNIFDYSLAGTGWKSARGDADDLMEMTAQVLGHDQARQFFSAAAIAQGREGQAVQVTPELVARLETRLAGAIGAATAHAMVGQIVGGSALSVDDLLAVADESAQILEYSSQLEAKSAELAEFAAQLHAANAKMRELSEQKDAFLSQVSHELRTPMTSIRAFAEILREADTPPEQHRRYARIIFDESQRLTRLLDELLDLNVLESGKVKLNLSDMRLEAVIDRALAASGITGDIRVERDRLQEGQRLTTDADRLVQVFVNLFSNAQKYNDNPEPVLRIQVQETAQNVQIEVYDNGTPLASENRDSVFEKFIRASDRASGAGLGLAICREIMTRLNGKIVYAPRNDGNAFVITLPMRLANVAAQ